MKKKYILPIVLLILTSISYFYIDISSNIRQGMCFWEALFSGKLFQYYSLNHSYVEAGLMVHEANYDIFASFLLSIWQLPLFIIEKIVGGNILANPIACIYGSLYPVLINFFIIVVLKHIALYYVSDQKKAELVVLIYLTSSLTMVSCAVVSQMDILGVLFILYAFESLLKDRKIKFLLFLFLAVQCKFFALFIFIPILLLKEKNLLKVGITVLIPLALGKLFDLPFTKLDPVGTASKKTRFHTVLFELTAQKVNLLGVAIPILFIVFGGICIWAYLKKEADHDALLYGGYLGISAALLCFQVSPYWMIYVVPFGSLLLVKGAKNLTRALLVESGVTLALTVGFMIKYAFIFDYQSIMLYQFGNASRAVNGPVSKMGEALMSHNYCDAYTLCFGIYVAWLFIMLVKWRKSANETEALQEKPVKMLLCARIVLAFVLCMLPSILYMLGI